VYEHAFVHSTNHKGAVAEAKIVAEALDAGVSVLTPVAEHGHYDLAFDVGERILRVQCKWGALDREKQVICTRVGRSRHSCTFASALRRTTSEPHYTTQPTICFLGP
jgi:hypothetical protein